MNPVELRQAIAARVRLAVANNIWRHGIDITNILGTKVQGEGRGPFDTKVEVNTRIGGVEFKTSVTTVLRMNGCPRLTHFTITADGKTRFDAREVFEENQESSGRYFTERKKTVRLDVYIPGTWQNWLNSAEITLAFEVEKIACEEQNRTKERDRAATVLERERTRPLTIEEQLLAADFGITDRIINT